MESLFHKIAKHIVATMDMVPVLADMNRANLADVFIQPRLTTVKGETVGFDTLQTEKIRAIVVGGAGSGKTTLLKYHALQT